MQKGCKTMKKSASVFILMMLVIVLLISMVCYGVRIGDGGLKSIFEENSVIMGLDLVGGTSITFEANAKEGMEAEAPSTDNLDPSVPQETVIDGITDSDMDAVVAILGRRATNANYTEAQVVRLNTAGKNRIRVDIPDVDDAEAALELMGKTAQLTFFYITDAGELVEVLTGDQVKSAVATTDQTLNHVVALQLDDSARQSFAEATRITSQTGSPIYILLDDEIISAPVANEEINSTECIITGDFDAKSAADLANLISSGNLPCELTAIETRTVGASLGDNAFKQAMTAGVIGVILVMLFMIIMYRLPGVVSALALVAYIALTCICLVLFKVNLSLPAIAGIFLTIGMAVDANVVIFERIKEELNAGKSVKAAVKAGFNRAFTAIIDSNITTLIAAVVLWYFGTGAIQGFAVTLFLGVVLSLITALFITKVLLNALVGMGVTNIKLFGAKSADKQ